MLGRGNRTRYGIAIAAVGVVMAFPPTTASAGFFDFLFGGFARHSAPPPPAAAPTDRADPNAGGSTRRDGLHIAGGLGPATSLCVRTCDGRYFPIQRSVTATPQQLCSALCPAATTKVYFGSNVARATASNGSHYEDLDNAFLYRQKVVDGCTCNGRTPFGLARLDAHDDPTLRPGDLVQTGKGLVKSTPAARTAADTSDDDVTASLPSGLRGYVSHQEEAPLRLRRDPFSLLNGTR